MSSFDEQLPDDLPVPEDDGAADHLIGLAVPALGLLATTGDTLRVDQPPRGLEHLVVYAYPRTGRPGEAALVEDWDLIPGARGCTPEACGFRDHSQDLTEHDAAVVGLSTQPTDDQLEAAQRLHLPFPLVSDASLQLTRAMRLPTLDVAGHTLLRRLTLIIRDGHVEHVFYPVFPPDTHANEILAWLKTASKPSAG